MSSTEVGNEDFMNHVQLLDTPANWTHIVPITWKALFDITLGCLLFY